MRYVVLKSFSGLVSGIKGRIIEIRNKAVASDLLAAGYIVKAPESKKTTKKRKEA